LIILQVIAAIVGLLTAGLLILVRRFGPATWLLTLFLIPAAIASLALTLAPGFLGLSPGDLLRLPLALLVLAAPGGVFASYTIDREDYRQFLRTRWRSLAAIALAAPLLSAAVLLTPGPEVQEVQLSSGDVLLGPAGYAAALYLLIVSVIVFANLEQTLRNAQEHVRWEIKFLLLGVAASYGGIVYISSRVLLYQPRYGLILASSLRLFPLIFLPSCGLMLVSWRRSSGHSRVVVSHGVVYSSITLLSVGIYLIVSSLAAKWASQWEYPGFPVDALVFLLAMLALAIALLWTDFRHRVKLWIRRNLLAGSYDYRLCWLEANERVRFIDRPEEPAAALLDIVQRSLGAIDISIWTRLRDPNRFKLLAARGEIERNLKPEVKGVVEKLLDAQEPLAPSEIDPQGQDEAITDFANQTHASLLVPLQSSNHLVGLLTLGPDRSGKPYGWEAREFLGVLGKHAASGMHRAELLETLVQAKETEAFRTFSTFVMHDLKNFASTLSLVARNAEKHAENPDFHRDAFRSVFETAEKMKRLCNSLRTFSSTLTPNAKLDNLSHIARAVADSFSVDLGSRLIQDLADVPAVLVDGAEIERVIQNLIINAREAISQDGNIILRTRCHDSTVELAVEDNGRGMSPEFVEAELFLPFHTTKSDGLGIGLFQSKKIVEAHKGTIRVETQHGKGTTVRVFFPVAKLAKAQEDKAV
jgi:putative PEP-CTERM system histidine kinase